MPKYKCDNCNKEFTSEQEQNIQCPNCFWSSSVVKLEANVPTDVPAMAFSIHDNSSINLPTLLHGKTGGVKQANKMGASKKQKSGYGCLVAVLLVGSFLAVIAVSNLGKARQNASQSNNAENLTAQEKSTAAEQPSYKAALPVTDSEDGRDKIFNNQTSLIMFLISNSGASEPEKKYLYNLRMIEVMQTAPDGVLLRINPLAASRMQTQVAFLYTDEKFVDGAPLDGYWAYYVGTYAYQSVIGTTKNVLAFKLYGKRKSQGMTGSVDPRNKIFSDDFFVKTFLVWGTGFTQPDEIYLYNLQTMQVMQSAPGGVLIQFNPMAAANMSRQPQIAFLYTDEKFVDGAPLDEYWAYYVGSYAYQSVVGAERNVLAFKLYGKRQPRRGYSATEESNFISVGGRVVPNPRKQRQT